MQHSANNIYLQAIEEARLASIKQRTFDKRVLVEPLILLAVLLGYCALQSTMQQRDLQAQLDERAKYRDAICQIQQYNSVHEFPCRLLNDEIAVKKWP
jgi:CRP-like cAMP-binding protein